MDALESNFVKLGKALVGTIFVWLGVVGLLDLGFTTIDVFPLIDLSYISTVVYVSQVLIGLAVFNNSLRRFAKPVAIVYFALILYNGYLDYPALFTPAIPYLSAAGQSVFLEILAIFAGFNYLKRRY